jgi:hypothetical protein
LLAAPFSHTILGCFSAAIKKNKNSQPEALNITVVPFSGWALKVPT